MDKNEQNPLSSAKVIKRFARLLADTDGSDNIIDLIHRNLYTCCLTLLEQTKELEQRILDLEQNHD